MDVVRRADWIVDVGPGAGERGGRRALQRPGRRPGGRRGVGHAALPVRRGPRAPRRTARRRRAGCTCAASRAQPARRRRRLPLGVLTAVTGVSGSGKSTLVTRCSPTSWPASSAGAVDADDADDAMPSWTSTSTRRQRRGDAPTASSRSTGWCASTSGRSAARRARTSRPTPGCSTPSASVFAATDEARAPRLTRRAVLVQRRRGTLRDLPGRGLRRGRAAVPARHLRAVPDLPRRALQPRRRSRCATATERSPTCWRMTVDEALEFLADVPGAARSLETLREVGLGYLRLGQPATELSGGEAQRIKLATELQRARRGHALYLLDEPTTGPAPGRRRAAAAPAAPARRRRQHRRRGRARHGRHRQRRLGHRPRPRRRRRRRPRGSGGAAEKGGTCETQRCMRRSHPAKRLALSAIR